LARHCNIKKKNNLKNNLNEETIPLTDGGGGNESTGNAGRYFARFTQNDERRTGNQHSSRHFLALVSLRIVQ
jgi:hypothetical protein